MKYLLMFLIVGLLMSSFVPYEDIIPSIDKEIERMDIEAIWIDKLVNVAFIIAKAMIQVGYGLADTFGVSNAIFWAFALLFVDLLWYPVAWVTAVIVILVYDHVRNKRQRRSA